MSSSSEQPVSSARRAFLKHAALSSGAFLALAGIDALSPLEAKARRVFKTQPQPSTSQALPLVTKALSPIDFSARLSKVEGLSQGQLTQHVKLYEGYVGKFNSLQNDIAAATPDLDKMNATTSPYRAAHVEQTFALNGVLLHEAYFGNLGGDKTSPSAALKATFAKHFGSWEAYLQHTTAVAKSFRGWAITAYNERTQTIANYGLDAHHLGSPLVRPLLVVDVYEHAYMIDYGINRAAYLNTFWANVDWSAVETRLNQALG